MRSTACIRHDQLISPFPHPPLLPANKKKEEEIVWICTLLDQQFGQTENHDSAFRSKLCLVYVSRDHSLCMRPNYCIIIAGHRQIKIERR
jgi:hypothetical protein